MLLDFLTVTLVSLASQTAVISSSPKHILLSTRAPIYVSAMLVISNGVEIRSMSHGQAHRGRNPSGLKETQLPLGKRGMEPEGA
jgi:hypothetical protein